MSMRGYQLGPDLKRAIMTGLLIGAWVGGAGLAVYVTVLHGAATFGVDSHAYWVAGHSRHPYVAAPGASDAFLYSPVFAQIMRPLSLLPWLVFRWLWLAVEGASCLWLTRSLPARWRIPLLLLCVPEVMVGNIHGLLGVVIVLSLSRPAAATFPLLTKVAPAAPLLLWFAVRGEWRRLTVGAVGALGIVAVSVALEPGLWMEWARFLLAHRREDPASLAWLAVGCAVAVIAARRGRAWLLPVGVWLALPMGFGVTAVPVVLASVRLWPVGDSADGHNRREPALPRGTENLLPSKSPYT
jgi:Glycosyltransferase family 87